MASFIGASGNNAGASTFLTTSSNLNVSVGDLIVVGVGAGTNVTTMTMTDSQGGGLNTYNAHPNNGFQINSPGKKMWSFYSLIASGSASMSFTSTANASSGMGLNITQYRGYLASPLDVSGTAVADSGTTTSHSPGTLSTTGANDTIVGVNVEIPVSAQTFTAGSGWTIGRQDGATAGCPTMTQYQLGQTLGNFTNNFTTAVATQDGGMIWAFKETGWVPQAAVNPVMLMNRKNVLYFI